MASRLGSRSKNTTSEASLLEQVRLLKIENDTLRSFIAEKGFDESSHVPPANADSKSAEKKSRRGLSSAFRSKKSPDVPTTPRTPYPISGKGCSCKGNCSTKVCGCVKKNIPCAEFCRCGDELCQNSEPDKENIGDGNQAELSKDDEQRLIQLSKLTIDDKKRPKMRLAEVLPTNKRLQKDIKPRSIFSPEVPENVFTFDDADIEAVLQDAAEQNGKRNESQEEPVRKSKKKNSKRTENIKFKLTEAASEQIKPLHPALSDNVIDDHSEPKLSNKSRNNVKKRGKATAKQNNLADLRAIDKPTQDHKDSEPEPTTDEKKKAEMIEKTSVPTERQEIKIDPDGEDSQENEYSQSETANNMNKKTDSNKTGIAKKQRNRITSQETDEESSQKSDRPGPETAPNMKIKIATKTTVAMKKKKNAISSEEIDEDDCDEDEPSIPKTSKSTNKKKKKVEYQNEATTVSKKRNHQTSDNEDSHSSTSSSFESESPNTNLKVSKKTTITRKAGKKNNKKGNFRKDDENSDSVSEPKRTRNYRINSGDIDESSQDTKNSERKSKIPNKNKNVAKKATHVKKRYYIESETDEESSQGVDHSDSEPELPNKNKIVAKKAMDTHDVNKQNNHVDSEDDDEITSQENENSVSDDEPAKWNEKKAKNQETTMSSEARGANRMYSEDIDDAAKKTEKTEFKPEPKNNDHGRNDVKKTSLENPTGLNASRNLSYGMDTLMIPESDDFNPMKPRRQLSRSPLAPGRQQRIDVSNVPLPIPVIEDGEEDLPPPAELAKDIVENWNEHLAMLVRCRKCNRTFHPHRVKIHEMHCIKI